MKKLINTSMALLLCVFLGAQAVKNNNFYLSGEYSLGNYVGLNQNVNFIFNESFSLQIGYSLNARKPKNYELSESDRRLIALTLGIGIFGIYDSFSSTRFLIGRPFWLNESKSTRLNFLGGVGFNSIGIRKDKYSDVENYKQVSFVFHPKFEFVNKSFIGTSVSFLAEINPKSPLFGLELGYMLGNVRKIKKD